MTRYRLPSILGGGECELLTPLELAQHTSRADVQVGKLVIDVPFGALTEVKPPLPPEPPVGQYLIGGRMAMRTSPEPAKCWVYETGGMFGEDTFARLFEIFCWPPGVSIQRLVPDPLAEAPDLPWTNEDYALLDVSFEIGCGCNGTVDGAQLVRLMLGKESVALPPQVARLAGLALLRAAAQQEAND